MKGYPLKHLILRTNGQWVDEWKNPCLLKNEHTDVFEEELKDMEKWEPLYKKT